MKIFELKDRAYLSDSGEHILGSEETASHACYMIYGILKAGEAGRMIKPGIGHEEIVLAAKGDISASGCYLGVLKEGSAFHITGNDECFLENRGVSEAVYIIAGGHSGGHHH
jgi:hypothetical protein